MRDKQIGTESTTWGYFSESRNHFFPYGEKGLSWKLVLKLYLLSLVITGTFIIFLGKNLTIVTYLYLLR